MRFSRAERLFAALVGGVLLLYALVSIVVRPAMFSDSAFGFLVWDSMVRGAGFNQLVGPNPADIAHDTAEFLTTWSPGQYIFPGLLETLGLPLGVAIALVTTIFAAVGLAGWYALYRSFGFPVRTVMIATTITLFARHLTLSFGIYTGGEILLFGLAGWFILLAWHLRELLWRSVPILIVASMVLIFAKLSGLILAAIVIGAVATYDVKLPVQRGTSRRLAVASVTIALMGVAFYVAWFSRGWSVLTPATGLQWSQLVPSAALAIAASWGGGASLCDLVHFVFLHPGRPLLKSATPIYLAMIPLALATFWLMARRLRTEYGSYLRFTALVCATFAAVMVVMWLRGAEIELEERHFRVPALLLLVGIVHAFISVPSRPVRAAFALVVTLGGLYGVASFANHASAALRHPLGIRGFRHDVISAPVLDLVHAIDRDAKGNGSPPIILVPTPELGLEIRQARLIHTHVDFETPERIRQRVWHGRVPKLFVILQSRMVSNGKAALTLRAFADIPASKWRMVPIDSEFVLFTAQD